MVSAPGPEPLILRIAARLVHGDIHAAQFSHHLVELIFHLPDPLRGRRVMNQILLLHRVSLNVKKLVRIPETVIGGIFVAIAA